jgi:hypothetical protein
MSPSSTALTFAKGVGINEAADQNLLHMFRGRFAAHCKQKRLGAGKAPHLLLSTY